MDRIVKILCLILLVISIFTVSVSAADFSFLFSGSGVKCSSSVKKVNTREYAELLISTSSYTYKYAVGTRSYGGYITNWKQKAGIGGLKIPYAAQPASALYLVLHGQTVSNSGASTVRGSWIP